MTLPTSDRLDFRRVQYRLRQPGWSYPLTLHPNVWEAYVCRQGLWGIAFPNQQFTLQPGQAFLIPPGVPHKVHVQGDAPALIVMMQFKADHKTIAPIGARVMSLAHHSITRLDEILDFWTDDPVADARRRALLSLFLLDLLHPHTLNPSPLLPMAVNDSEDDLIRQVLAAMARDLSAGLQLPALSKLTGYGASRLRHLFKQRTGVSLMQAKMQLRMIEAKRLLLYSGLKISAIARAVGFTHAPKFNQFFRKHAGCTPTEFTKSGQRLGNTWGQLDEHETLPAAPARKKAKRQKR